MKEKLRRKLKQILSHENKRGNITLVLFFFSLALFIFTTLYSNSQLSIQGIKLQALNTEKDLLLQENRELEKDLANSQSITVVQNLTNKKYKLSSTKTNQLVYVTGNITASR